jgi:pimeloyl-ACP methyl ester carboxylesterase
MEPTTFTVRSPDRTRVACHVSGTGPGVLLVHGAMMDAASWGAVRALLERTHTVYALDRRGHGGTGDPGVHDIRREVDDLRAVLDAIGKPTTLVGQSSGALLILHHLAAAPEPTAAAPAAVLVEPPCLNGVAHAVPDLPARLEALLAGGDRAGAVEAFLRHGPGLRDEDIAGMRRGHAWAGLVAGAHTLPYDATLGAADLDLTAVRVPVRLLVGGTSPAWMRTAVAGLAAALPHAELRELPGAGHDAYRAAPKLLAAEIAAAASRS